MSVVLAVVAMSGVFLWELTELRTDMLSQKTIRVAARKSAGFWILVTLVAVVLGSFWGYVLNGEVIENEPFLNYERPANALIIASLFSGFGSIPALKGFKLLPIVNKVLGKISFEDIAVKQHKGLFDVVRLWWSL